MSALLNDLLSRLKLKCHPHREKQRKTRGGSVAVLAQDARKLPFFFASTRACDGIIVISGLALGQAKGVAAKATSTLAGRLVSIGPR